MADVRAFGPLPHWDLSNVFPALESDELKAAIARFDAQLGELVRTASRKTRHAPATTPSVLRSTVTSNG